jgi:hypothetical protein
MNERIGSGQLFFASLNIEKCPTAIPRLLLCRGLNFDQYFNHSISTLKEIRSSSDLSKLGTAWTEIPTRLKCMPYFYKFKVKDIDFLLDRPWLWIDQIIQSQNVSPQAFAKLFNRSITSPFLRNSCTLCKSLEDTKLRTAVSNQNNYWMISDPYCFLTNPPLVSSMILSMMRKDASLFSRKLGSRIDRLLSVFAMTLIIVRLKQKEGIFVLQSIHRNLKIWMKWVALLEPGAEFSYFCKLLADELISFLSYSMGKIPDSNLSFDFRKVETAITRLWETAYSIEDEDFRSRLRFNLFIILIELEFKPKEVYHRRKWLQIVLGETNLQERHICILMDSIMSQRIKCESLRQDLLTQLQKLVIDRNFERPFVCKRSDGLSNLYLPDLDSGLLLRRGFFDKLAETDYAKPLNEKYLHDTVLNPALEVDQFRRLVVSHLRLIMDDYFVITGIDHTGNPQVISTLDLHPYKTLEFWYLLGLSNLLHLEMPFTIDPLLGDWFANGNAKIGRAAFQLAFDYDLKCSSSEEECKYRLNSIFTLWDLSEEVPLPRKSSFDSFARKCALNNWDKFMHEVLTPNHDAILNTMKMQWLHVYPRLSRSTRLQHKCKITSLMIGSCLTSPRAKTAKT